MEENAAKEVYESLKAVESVIKENGEYVKLLSSAQLSSYKREELVEEAFSGKIHLFALNFMKLLAKKRIFEILLPSIEEYEKKYLSDNNIQYATVTTAIELSEEKKKDTVSKIEKSTGKKIIAEFVVDKSIVGGIIIETENNAIDGSVAGKLDSMRRYLSKN